MNGHAYKRVVGSAHAVRMLARSVASDGLLDEAIAAIARADSVGAVLDPTLYRDRREAMAQDEATLRAVRVLAGLGEVVASEPGSGASRANGSLLGSPAHSPIDPLEFTDDVGQLRMGPAAS